MRFNPYAAFLFCILVGVFLFFSHIAFSDGPQTQPPAASQPPAAAQPAAPAETPEQLQARIDALIKQLGSDKFEDREAAQEALKKIGEPARNALAEALKNDDKEIAYRAEQTLAWLNLSRVTLQITDKRGVPLAGAQADIAIVEPIRYHGPLQNGEEYVPPEPEKISTPLSKDGTVSLQPRKPGTYQVDIKVQGYCEIHNSMTFGKGDQVQKVVAYKGGSIKGKVVDVKNNNKPLAGVTFRMYGSGNGEEQVTTDQNGEFLLEHRSPGKQLVYLRPENGQYVTADNDNRSIRETEVDVKDEETAEVTISMMEEKWMYGGIEGRLVTPEGKPYDGPFAVTSLPETESKTYDVGQRGQTMQDNGGALKLERLTHGKYTLIIEAKGYAVRIIKGMEVKGNEVTKMPGDVKLEKGTALKVKVLGADGKPAPEAIVFLANTADPPRQVPGWMVDRRGGDNIEGLLSWNTMQADKDGNCEFTLPDGKYALRACVSGGGMCDETIVDVKAGDNKPVEVSLSLKGATMVALSVVDKDTGNPVPNVRAMSYKMMEKEMEGHREAAREAAQAETTEHIVVEDSSYYGSFTPDEKGQIMLPPSSKGDKVLMFAPGYKAAMYAVEDVPAGKTTAAACKMEQLGTGDLKVTLVPGKNLKLGNIAEVYVNNVDTLFGAREPDPQSIVFRWGTKVNLDNAGCFEAKAAPEGACYISLFDKKGDFIAIFRADVEKGKTTEVKFNCPGLGKVEGVLTDSAGNKMAGAQVSLMPDSMLISLAAMAFMEVSPIHLAPTTTADENGHFVFDGVPEGNYILTPGGQGGVPEIMPVSVTAGNTVKADMQLHDPIKVPLILKDKTVELSGMIVVEHSTGPVGLVIPPGREATVELHGEGDKSLSIRPGKHVLLIAGEGPYGFLQPMDVTPDTKSIEVAVPPTLGARAIKGKITRLSEVMFTPLGAGLVAAMGEHCFAFGYVLPDGSFEIHGLEPGKYKLFPISLDEACTNRADLMHMKEVTVEEGKDAEGVEIP